MKSTRNPFKLEALEPRLLLSGDPALCDLASLSDPDYDPLREQVEEIRAGEDVDRNSSSTVSPAPLADLFDVGEALTGADSASPAPPTPPDDLSGGAEASPSQDAASLNPPALPVDLFDLGQEPSAARLSKQANDAENPPVITHIAPLPDDGGSVSKAIDRLEKRLAQ